MKVTYLRSFLHDIKKIKDRRLKNKLKDFLLNLENAKTLDDVPHVSKLRGYTMAYRARIGDYRLGFYCEDKVIEVARFVKGNDIYKVFPKKG